MKDVTVEQLLEGFAKATSKYIADERSTHESCAALGEHSRSMLKELDLEKEFLSALAGQAQNAMTELVDALMESLHAAD